MKPEKDLLELSRKVIQSHFKNQKVEVSDKIKKKYSEKQACFVTLTKNGNLRGCVGSLYAHQPLYKDVIDNTINAAFNDYRFTPLSESELSCIKIEISVLSVAKKLDFSSSDELLKKLNHNMGVILKKGSYSATYLPQVWEELPDKIEFLSSLCLKAGLPSDSWKREGIEVYTYTVEKVKE